MENKEAIEKMDAAAGEARKELDPKTINTSSDFDSQLSPHFPCFPNQIVHDAKRKTEATNHDTKRRGQLS